MADRFMTGADDTNSGADNGTNGTDDTALGNQNGQDQGGNAGSDDNAGDDGKNQNDGSDDGKGDGADKGDDKANDGDDKKDKKEEEPRAPEKYESFTLPEGFEPNPEAAEEFMGVAKELDLTQEQAQGLVDYQTKKLQEATEQQTQAVTDYYEQRDAKWLEELKGEYGDGLGERTKDVQRVIATFDDDEGTLVKMLDEFGLDKARPLFNFLGRVKDAVSDDVLVGGDNGGKGNADQPDYMKMGWKEVK